jgi:phosphoserine phosphatase RsbU/P
MSMDAGAKPGDRLALLYQLSQTFNSSLDLDEVLNRVMDEVITATRAERGFVMLKDEPGSELAFRVARGMEQQIIDDPQFQISRSIVERVAREGRAVLTSDAQTDERFNLRQSVMILGLRSILCVPLNLKDRTLGVVYVDNRLQAGIFTQGDLDLLAAIASSAAVAIENARLYQVAVEKGRMEQEMQVARRVQFGLLPKRLPEVEGWEFAAYWQPARMVGGDYYDYIPAAEGRLGLLIADVTDKGMPAALFMAFTRSVVRTSMALVAKPAEGICRANRIICEDAEDALFVSLFYAQLDPVRGELCWVNAGHHPPLLCHQNDSRVEHLSPTGLPLGMESEAIFEERITALENGDFVVLYTDGILDASRLDGQEFGMERLKSAALAARQQTAVGIVAAIETAVEEFTAGAPPIDDITLLVIKRVD